jgi:septal ring factor EnvC (AmiA/AmiB activator)
MKFHKAKTVVIAVLFVLFALSCAATIYLYLDYRQTMQALNDQNSQTKEKITKVNASLKDLQGILENLQGEFRNYTSSITEIKNDALSSIENNKELSAKLSDFQDVWESFKTENQKNIAQIREELQGDYSRRIETLKAELEAIQEASKKVELGTIDVSKEDSGTTTAAVKTE